MCHLCADAIIQTGITKVIMDSKPQDRWEESCNLALEKFNEAGIEWEIIEE